MRRLARPRTRETIVFRAEARIQRPPCRYLIVEFHFVFIKRVFVYFRRRYFRRVPLAIYVINYAQSIADTISQWEKSSEFASHRILLALKPYLQRLGYIEFDYCSS